MIEIVKNRDTVIQFVITELYDANGNKLSSLSGLNFEFNAENDTHTTVISKSSATGGIIINPTAMTATVIISRTDTQNLKPYQMLYGDLVAVDTAGKRIPILTHEYPLPIRILPNVSP